MNVAYNFITNQKDEILTGIVVTIACGFIMAFISKVVTVMKNKFFHLKSLEPEEQAIYLNAPQFPLHDNCIGRNKLLKKVFGKITDGKKLSFTSKCIVITGEDGIGKTLFCYTLFRYYLKRSPVYIGWIDCNGKQSVFDIIKNTFGNSWLWIKDNEGILNAFESMNMPCVLFVDQVNQFTPIDELETLSRCSNVILVISGVLRKIYFADKTVVLPPLSENVIRIIFEKQAKEIIDLMKLENKDSVNHLLKGYIKGNPSLAIAFANAKEHYGGKWENILKSMQGYEFNDNYIKNILYRLYKMNQMGNLEKNALSKLSTIQFANYTNAVFEFLDISDSCVEVLSNTYWLKKEDRYIYIMDKTHYYIISKVLSFEVDFINTVHAINEFLCMNRDKEDNGFRWLSPYIEGTLKKIQAYDTHIMEEEIFYEFAYNVAEAYKKIYNAEKTLKWIRLCKSKNAVRSYLKAVLEFQITYKCFNTLFSFSEVEQLYFCALEKAKMIDNFEYNNRFLLQEYCNFLFHFNRYNDSLPLCKEYFETYSMDLSDSINCDMFYRCLHVANILDDKALLKSLVNETAIQSLYQNENISISAAWSFGELGKIFERWGDKETADIYTRHMVVLLNEERGFFHNDIKLYLNISDLDFAEYVHSCDELLDSLNSALIRKDAEALYIEGRYQEQHGNFDVAVKRYEEAAARDSLRGMCSLALLYYRGQGERRDYDRAKKYWEYCSERGHRGSYYWLGILFLDANYDDRNTDAALVHLKKAAELGSERAKQKLLEF